MKIYLPFLTVFAFLLSNPVSLSASGEEGELPPSVVIYPEQCGLGNGAIDVTPDPNTPGPHQFQWSNGATTEDISGLTAGTYFLVVTDANGSTQTAQILVTAQTVTPTVLGTATGNTLCGGNGNGSIDVTVLPQHPDHVFAWSNGATTLDISDLVHGTYTLTITYGVTCITEVSYTVPDETDAPNPGLYGTAYAWCGLANGGAAISATGYDYLWSNGVTTRLNLFIPGGDYTVTITGSNGCTLVLAMEVENVNWNFLFEELSVEPNTTCIGGNGHITQLVHPLAHTLNYVWSNGATTLNLANLTSGTYTVTVSYGLTCSATHIYYIEHEPVLPDLVFTNTPTTCGFSNGFVNLATVGQGTPPYQFQWSNGSTTQHLNNIPEGSYTVTVTGTNQCTTTGTAEIIDTDIPFSFTAAITDHHSCDTSNGQINLYMFPSNLSYTWSTGVSNAPLKNLAPGDYTVTVSAGGTCTSVETFSVADLTEYPVIPAVPTASTCGHANGSVDLTVLGYAPTPYAYAWSNGATSEDLAGINAGTYTVTVTTAVGCTQSNTVAVPDLSPPIAVSGDVTDNSSCSNPAGAVLLNFPPPDTAYSFLWSNASTGSGISGLPAGEYSVTVSAGTCQGIGTFEVMDEMDLPNITPSVTASVCEGNNGAVSLDISAASGPYSFIWSNAETTAGLSGIPPGNYAVTVTSGNGCTQAATVNVPNDNPTFNLSGTVAPATNCATDNGAVEVAVGASGTFQYHWSTGATTQDLTGVPPGTYTVVVTDPDNCTDSASFVVGDQRNFPTVSAAQTPELCGLSDGALSLDVSGGAPPYTYLWDSGQTSPDQNNLSAGAYSVTVTDSNQCSTTINAVVLPENIAFSLTGIAVPNSSCVSPNGSAAIAVSPITVAHTYLWSNGETGATLSSLDAGTYTVTVSTVGNCTSTASFVIDDDTPAPSLSSNNNAAFCGQASGSIALDVSGSTAPFLFQWSNGAAGQHLQSLYSGTYTVLVTAANGCTSSAVVVVPENTVVPAIAASATSATSCVSNNGAIDLSVAPAMTYTFLWSNGSDTEDLGNIAAGTYTVTVNGGGACTNTASVTVDSETEAVTLSGQTTPIPCHGGDNGAIELSVNSGVGPFQYDWSPVVTGSPTSLVGLSAGTYEVTVTDANGCTSAASFAVAQPGSPLQAHCAPTSQVSEPGLADGAAGIDIFGGTGPYTVSWSPGGAQTSVQAGIFPLANLTENDYQITVLDANGCSSECEVSISVTLCSTTLGNMGASPLTLCGSGCATAIYSPSGQILAPSDLVQFVLHIGDGDQIVGEIARSATPEFCFDPATMAYGTSYYISAIAGAGDSNGNVNLIGYCAVSTAGTPVQFFEQPVASAIAPPPINCANPQVTLEGASSLGNSSFEWVSPAGTVLNGPNQSSVTVSAAGSYTLTVNENGCTSSATVTLDDLTNHPQVSVSALAGTVLNCAQRAIPLTGAVSGTANPYSAVWSDQSGTVLGNGSAVTAVAPGVYTLEVVDNVSFCSSSASIFVGENIDAPVLSVSGGTTLTCSAPEVSLWAASPNPGVSYSWGHVVGADTVALGNMAAQPVTSPGHYVLIGVNPDNHCQSALSVTVTADQTPPVADAGPSVTLDCTGASAALHGAGAANLHVQWTTTNGHIVSGGNTFAPLVNQSGTYVLEVTDPANGCTASDTVAVAAETAALSVSTLQPACHGEKGTLAAASLVGLTGPVAYKLNDGPSTPTGTFHQLAPGHYTLTALGTNGCHATATATIEEPELLEINLTAHTEIDLGHSVEIHAELNVPSHQIASVTWAPPTGLECGTCLTTVAAPISTTQYQLRVVSNEGCEARAQVLVKVNRARKIYAPNIFSPDGSGPNALFTIFADPASTVMVRSLQIYSRWGEEVYEQRDMAPNDPDRGWDGSFRGQKLNPGVFVWKALVLFVDGKEELFVGDVTLQR